LSNYSFTDAFQKALYADPYAPFTPEQLLGYASAEPPVFPPGQGVQYSNTNTVLLRLVVEKLSGQSLADHGRDHILLPLGLGATNFPTYNAPVAARPGAIPNWAMAHLPSAPTAIRRGAGRPAR
jgi:D-alanyl-D-alanine carboxypeptidase